MRSISLIRVKKCFTDFVRVLTIFLDHEGGMGVCEETRP